MRAFAIGLVLWIATGASVAAPRFDDPEIRARYQNLISELRCVICLNQSIASSAAPLARDMRQLVAEKTQAGYTDAEIKDYLVEHYGTFILYDPPFLPATWLLWLGPAALLVIGLVMALVLLRHSRRIADDASGVDRERLAQILDETSDGQMGSHANDRFHDYRRSDAVGIRGGCPVAALAGGVGVGQPPRGQCRSLRTTHR